MVGFVEDEIDFKKEQGYSELSDQKWRDIRDMAVGEDGVQSALDELKKALDNLIDDEGDWLDVEVVEDDADLDGGCGDPGIGAWVLGVTGRRLALLGIPCAFASSSHPGWHLKLNVPKTLASEVPFGSFFASDVRSRQ